MMIRIILGLILSSLIWLRVDWTVGSFAVLMLIYTEMNVITFRNLIDRVNAFRDK